MNIHISKHIFKNISKTIEKTYQDCWVNYSSPCEYIHGEFDDNVRQLMAQMSVRDRFDTDLETAKNAHYSAEGIFAVMYADDQRITWRQIKQYVYKTYAWTVRLLSTSKIIELRKCGILK